MTTATRSRRLSSARTKEISMTTIQIEIEVDDEFDDPTHEMGITDEGFEALTDAVNAVGVITSGPTKVQG
ncbi:hypothetical protein SEA_ANTUNA_46 [Microbacterium phage Antuna]|nr:hypothetical protein SEA_ANTUNA_46 [Microbacterium phage Antuna]